MYIPANLVQTWEAHLRLAQKLAINKNPQFFPKQADIQVILSNHGLIIWTKFHNFWEKMVDFFMISQFLGPSQIGLPMSVLCLVRTVR